MDEVIKQMALKELVVRYQDETNVLWTTLNPKSRQCFTLSMLQEVKQVFNAIDNLDKPPYCLVVNSSHPEVFNSGGDLLYFIDLIHKKDEKKLLEYGLICIDLIHWLITGGRYGVVTIAGVAGSALGGGFECALACNYIIAEKRSTFALPEIIFGLLPGMGGFAMLARYIGITGADRVFSTGKLYSARELHDLGVVYKLVENGQCNKEIEVFVKSLLNKQTSINILQKLKRKAFPITYSDLQYNVELWVGRALQLNERDTRKMQRLARRQEDKRLFAAC